MISEFDDMVGAYIDAVAKADPSVASNTVFIVSSDHGDMQMEHAQFYKVRYAHGQATVRDLEYEIVPFTATVPILAVCCTKRLFFFITSCRLSH